MLFVEFRFLVFFAVFSVIYWTLPKNSHRKLLILLGSYVFYASWDYRFLALIWLSTIVDYVAALQIDKSPGQKQKRLWLIISLCTNLGILGVFKYFDFFAQSLIELFETLGMTVNYTTINIVLPVGISFYTFQTLSYTIDVYRKEMHARRNFLDIAVFVAFFPQLVAGPILRAKQFLPQLAESHKFANVAVKACLALFVIGFFKKAVVSDNLAPFVDVVFADPGLYAAYSVWGAVLFGVVQFYCDFSGYSDMAVATAGLLGFRIPQNFDAPYLATNIAELWRRWHITLTNWMRDYV